MPACVTLSGNEIGLSEPDAAAMGDSERTVRLKEAERRLSRAGAHYVTESIGTCRAVLAHIEERIIPGEYPSPNPRELRSAFP